MESVKIFAAPLLLQCGMRLPHNGYCAPQQEALARLFQAFIYQGLRALRIAAEA